jgi:hypothetical protein
MAIDMPDELTRITRREGHILLHFPILEARLL